MKTQIRNLCVVAIIAVLSGCSSLGGSKGDGSDVVVEDRGAGADGAVSSGAAGSGGISGYALDDPNSPLARRVIYFEFDSSEIAGEDQEVLSAHANHLATNGGSLVMEGHADERGSREYNIGLGDRRAQAVRRVLELNGVSGSQLSVVSYGEEKPAAEGHSETAWRLNRRVELVY